MGCIVFICRRLLIIRFALKFFGYTKREVNKNAISNEINLMRSFKGIPGIVQLEGIIIDTEVGLIPNKIHLESYPILVMEMLGGGDLFAKIANRSTMSERFLAGLFRSVLLSVSNIHKMGFIHRDLKLENLMLPSSATATATTVVTEGKGEEDSDGNSDTATPRVTVIDFGAMVQCAAPSPAPLAVSASQQQQQQQQPPPVQEYHEISGIKHGTPGWGVCCLV